jgi:lysozyme
MIPRRALLLSLPLAVLSGCAAARRGPSPVSAADPRPARFGDSDPVDWQGRSPAAHPVHGIDTARYQGRVDWPAARAAGVSFAFLKATEGADRLDPAFHENWQAAARAGVPRGAYHFFYLCGEAAAQARWFIRHVPREAGALPPVLDMEWTPFSPTCRLRPPEDRIRQQAQEFMARVETHYGQPPILYSTVEFWTANRMWLIPGRHDYWLRSTAAHPDERYGGQPWTFWQYSATGRVPGVSGPVDLNAFHGSRADWADWLARRS